MDDCKYIWNSSVQVVFEVCDAITKHLGPEYIHLPRNAEEMHGKVSEFELKFGMTQEFGCIDGTHIPIKTPTIDSRDYFCYKQYYSRNVQAVCDYRGMFIDVGGQDLSTMQKCLLTPP